MVAYNVSLLLPNEVRERIDKEMMTLSGSGITRKQFVEMCMMACNSSEDVYHCFSYSFNQRETPFCRNCVIRSRRSRSAAAYSLVVKLSRERSVGPSVDLSVHAVHCGKRRIGSGCRLAP